jgi:predicted dehydrogenase/threonine dehydrogenase-like Zn-dependent dehydrogenase
MLVEFGRASLLEKTRQQPEKVSQVVRKIRTDGLFSTIEAVRAKLDQPVPLGYCNAGTVLAVGADVPGFSVGDQVVSNGPHAEIVCVPRNLCCRVPENVPASAAAFTVAGAIALQGIRLAEPAVGETVVVLGLGLIGLLTVQILRAGGCRVLGTDFDAAKCDLARRFGAKAVELLSGSDPVAAAEVFSRGRGVDAVLITASTKSSEPVSQAARMCRKRGRIVLVGVTGLELKRAEFYEKELRFQVSCSYGPGRYDPEYEQAGRDYPVGFVRWTEQRNFEAVLDLLSSGAIDTGPLTSHRFEIERALEAYDLVAKGAGLGLLLEYPRTQGCQPRPSRTVSLPKPVPPRVTSVVVGVIGAGNYIAQALLPALARNGVRLRRIVSASGVTATHLGRKFGFEQAGTDAAEVFADPEINTVLIATRHDSHARFVVAGLRTAKRVFVEKPLALSEAELEEVEKAWQAAEHPFVLVGFNRRFAPQSVTVKRLLAARAEPVAMHMTVNAGALPAGHWTLDPIMGGGRIVGEGCHFVDLLRHLAGASIVEGKTTFQRVDGVVRSDVASVQLEFANGSVGTLHYWANGSRNVSKERLEIFCGGGVLQLDNFRQLRGIDWPGFTRQNLFRQDKGHAAELATLVAAVRDGRPSPIPWPELVEVSRWSLRLAATEGSGTP